MKMYADYIGKIEPISRSASRIECMDCGKIVSDDAPAFVYHDLQGPALGGELFLLCEDCHRKPD